MARLRKRRLARRDASHGPAPRFEQLENRRLLTFVWVNRGDASDQFDVVFGASAAIARGVVDSAINEWNRVVVGYGGQDFETDMTIKMNPANTSVSAVASNTARDANGVPVSGDVTINTALDGSGNTQWYLDPTPDDHSEFLGDLKNPFARNPTPGGPADGMRDLRTLLVHELGHTMGIASGSPLMYSNPAITMTNTGITDNSVGSGSNSYWLFQGPSVNAVMTDYDIAASGNVTSTAGHNAMPLPGNTPINFNGQLYYTDNDTMQPTSLSVRRVLLSDKTALMMKDMGYDVVMPETFGTFHSVLSSASGLLRIQGGNDDTLINNVDQGPSSDTISLLRFGGLLFVGVDLGVDVPGAGNGLTPQDQQGIYISRFNISDVHSILIEGFGGDDTINLIGDFDFLNSLVVIGGDGDDAIDGSALTGALPLIAFGSNGDDVLTGGPGPDVLSGLGGNDLLIGGGGADLLIGGTGNDAIRGGSGNDEIEGGSGNDNLQGNEGADTISGGNGDDLIVGGTFVAFLLQNLADGSDTISGGSGNDVIIGDNALGVSPAPLGGAGDDIEGDDGNDRIYGGNGDDLLIGGLGADALDGGTGDDELIGGTLLSNVSDASADVLSGGAGNDTLLGDNLGFGPSIGGPDLLSGDEGDDVLYGQYDDDLLIGGLGADLLEGGDGADILIGGTLLGAVDLSSDELDGGNGDDLLLGDNLTFSGPGAGGGDVMRGGAGDDAMYGQYGNDTMTGGSGDDYMFGASGNDRLDGESGDDILDGGTGDDVLIGGLGSDALSGGNGDDLLIGGTLLSNVSDASADDLDGGSGDDLLIGDNFGFGVGIGGPDTLRGGSGNDAIYGQYGDDDMSGGAGDDYLSGGDGNDRLAGDAGNDTLNGDAGADHIEGGAGNDVAHGGANDDLIRGGAGADQLDGDDGDDVLLGEAGRDVLNGGAGATSSSAVKGSDRLAGGEGEDILIGGSTRHDQHDEALLSILAEWTSRRSYASRVANLRAQPNPTFGSRLNGPYFLRGRIEVIDDFDPDALSGEADRDWFFASLGDATDQLPGEALN